ncbi:S-adenosyl-L-methionine-dependent methyltransferase [Dacryopinax primogenitus]|uniref:phosphoethanolamine N-methyltransferase n=1 Tax=Dacryopinax primogenitus (strain DJM 731) TaxID=1858805 RepID=M5FU53_DACPD|nr:S-adenosyl-L-methionine-dependent methyltransferase [Dacryopinax primogenitus]EJU01216.1 S-adenosyl-L-methionine-dependent methyltransferase [Dacryopinax primogenitus]
MAAYYILGVHRTVLITALFNILTAYAFLALLKQHTHPSPLSLEFPTLLAYLSTPTISILHPLTLPALLPPEYPKLLRLAAAALACLVAWRQYLPEPYGLHHVQLNESGAEWGNMGLWEPGRAGFERAAEALALRVIAAGRCKKGGKVLDVGHGTGDSLLLHLQHPSVPRPSLLVGITSLAEQHTRSHSRLRTYALPSSSTTVRLFQGDAISRPPLFAPVLFGHYAKGKHEHPLYWDSSFPLFDSILSIDSAYHYSPRAAFFSQAFRRLAPGGTLALADVLFAPPEETSLGQRAAREGLAALMSVPLTNLVQECEYTSQLQRLGFTDVRIEDVTPSVFPGFGKYLASRGGAWAGFANVVTCWRWAGARVVLDAPPLPRKTPKTVNKNEKVNKWDLLTYEECVTILAKYDRLAG